jgi:hypothetical protein
MRAESDAHHQSAKRCNVTRFGEAVPGDVLLRNRVPCPMFDRYARFLAGGFENYFDLGGLLGREVCLAPGEDEALARLPNRNSIAGIELLRRIHKQFNLSWAPPHWSKRAPAIWNWVLASK